MLYDYITVIVGFKWLVDNNNKRAGLGSHPGMGLKMDENLAAIIHLKMICLS